MLKTSLSNEQYLAPVEFPLYASVDAYRVGGGMDWPDDGLMIGRAF